MNKQTRAEHYEMLLNRVLEEIKTGKGGRKKTTIMIHDGLWKLAGIEAKFQDKNMSEVIESTLVYFITHNDITQFIRANLPRARRNR